MLNISYELRRSHPIWHRWEGLDAGLGEDDNC